LITANQSLAINRDLRRVGVTIVSAHVPTETACTECGQESFFGGPKDITCTTCGGDGVTRAWEISQFPCRVMWVDPAHMRFVRGGVAFTGEVGDVGLQIGLEFQNIIDAVRNSPNAYITVDNQKIRPRSDTPNRVIELSSVDVRCDLVRNL
jgi:hypothetical protein